MERQQLYCKKVINPKVLITSLIFFASFLMIGELNHAWAAEETVNSQKNINVNNTINLVEKNSLKSVDDKASYKETINNKISVFNNEN
ncbi:cell wall hydrolase, partial [Staphylococcus lugdunensis]|nr:cell wall hydrolase [Staphylococcus lugdunensis]